jgi:uncharacterized protein (DUF1501 family)
MSLSRREFLAGGLGAGLSLPLIQKGLVFEPLSAMGGTEDVVVFFQLRGGNDMLHNIFTPDEAKYGQARPTLKIPKTKGIQVKANSPYYLNPNLASFKTLFDAGDLAIVNGVGYPNPNYSHFRSLDIIATADPTATSAYAGWLGTYLKKAYTGGFQIPAIDLESKLNRFFVGRPIPTFTNAANFKFRPDSATSFDQKLELALLESNAKAPRPGADPNLQFVSNAVGTTPGDVGLIQNTGTGYKPKVTYPSANANERRVSASFQTVARYIVGGLRTHIYQFSLGGFDTHANEVLASDPTQGNLAALLKAVSDGTKAFLDDLKAQGTTRRVVVYIFSEFGRRVGENGNNGTDHGAAGVAYVAGSPVKGGLYGAFPDWSKVSGPSWNRQNFMATTDFRSVYATFLENYWKVNSALVLGKKWTPLSFL